MPWRLTEDEQQLLRSAQSEHGDQTSTFSVHDVVDRVAEPSLALLTLLVDVRPVGRLLTHTHTHTQRQRLCSEFK